jgi:hypothetical protein
MPVQIGSWLSTLPPARSLQLLIHQLTLRSNFRFRSRFSVTQSRLLFRKSINYKTRNKIFKWNERESPRNIIRVAKSLTIWWAGYVARIGKEEFCFEFCWWSFLYSCHLQLWKGVRRTIFRWLLGKYDKLWGSEMRLARNGIQFLGQCVLFVWKLFIFKHTA